ncbi:hypothetical protein [Methanosarcina thermophila]|uniref:hypothetical protein n=1 Tax=Methanosarcina thermophila TaxID=2210 RepID=UPI0018CE8C32|nr:hypothetical protein [Methanosarcina thermophila]
MILVVFAGIGYVGDRGKNESVSSMENTSGNAAAGGGETLTIFHNRVWRNHS